MSADEDQATSLHAGFRDAEKRPHSLVFSIPPDSRCLDAAQLAKIEQSFRSWALMPKGLNLQWSRKRIFLIFLLIRYTGVRLNEVLSLDPFQDIDFSGHLVYLGKAGAKSDRPARDVQIPEALSSEIRAILDSHPEPRFRKDTFRIDPAHVRRKFYERTQTCGFPKELGAPDAIRKARAVEMMQNNMPLPVVQRILGHSTPSLAAAYVEFSDEDMRQLAKHFIDKESRRKTSARNMFYGKVRAIRKGDIQSVIEILTIGDDIVTTVITNDSLERLGLKPGLLGSPRKSRRPGHAPQGRYGAEMHG
jgi:molybdate transport system regulatory protein